MLNYKIVFESLAPFDHGELLSETNCNLFTHKALKSAVNSFKCVCVFQIELEFGSVGF